MSDLRIIDGADLQFVEAKLTAAIDTYIAMLPDGTSRPEAIRLILNDWLIGHGFIPFHEDPEMAN